MQTYLFVYLHFKNKLKNNIMIPQIIYLVFLFATLMISSYNHGKPKTGKENVWVSLISAILLLGLLYWGGFFDVFFK